MQVTLPDHLDLAKRANEAGFGNVTDYLADLVEQDIDRSADREAILEGYADMQAGRSKPLDEFDAEFRQRHQLPPRS